MTPLQLRLLVSGAFISACLLFWISATQDIVRPSQISKIANDYLSDSKTLAHGGNAEGLAYMTFLSGTTANLSDPNPEHDHYFVATRLLTYQLLYAPETRTNRSIPFVVLVTDDVPENKRERLRKDGATVIPVEYLRGQDWIVGGMPEWKDVMTKLRAWQLTQYSRVAFLDGDMILNRCLDGVFDDPATQLRPADTSFGTDDPIPSEYLFASIAETNPWHGYPPTADNGDYKDPNYFNAGFFVFAPSQQMFEYYNYLMEHEGSFDPVYPEQNLMNHAHRQDGLLSWQRMNATWNIRFPSSKDKEQGVASMHDKWWHAHMDPTLQTYYDSLRWTMEGYYEAMDQLMQAQTKTQTQMD